MKAESFDKLIGGGLLSAVAFTSLAHGAVEAWSIAVFELLILLLMFLLAIRSCVRKKFELKIPPTALPLAAFLVCGLIQSVSLNGQNGQIRSLSFDVEATRSAVKILFFLIVAHVLAANFFAGRERLRRLANFLTIFGFALAIFGLIQYFTWNGNIYWLRPALVTTGGVIGPFVNHNHFAGYLELLVPLPIALIVTGAVNKNRLLYGFAAVIMSVALIASLSRGGIVSLIGGMFFIAVAGVNYQRRQTRLHETGDGDEIDSSAKNNFLSVANLGAIVLIIGAVVLGTLWIGGDSVTERLTKNNFVSADEKAESFENSRGWIWENSAKMFQANLIYGVGIGAFETAYPQFSRDNHSLSQTVDRAHNDYLQILTDAGLIGGAIAVWFVLTVVFAVKQSLRAREPFRAALAIGCGAAIFSIAIHSIFDFNLQLLSTSLLFLILIAVSTNSSDETRVFK